MKDYIPPRISFLELEAEDMEICSSTLIEGTEVYYWLDGEW